MGINLSIKNVPEDVAERLRRRAERHHRSLQGELMAIVEAASHEPAPDAPPGAGDALWTRGRETVEEIAAGRQGRFPRPVAQGPLAVDIVRADRDRR